MFCENYMGVSFLPRLESVSPGEPFTAELALMYYPNVDYSELVPGATFTIREGGKIVGTGKVLARKP